MDSSQPSEPAFSMDSNPLPIAPFPPIPNTSFSYKSPNFSNNLPTGIPNLFVRAIFRRWRVPFHKNIIREGLGIHFLWGFFVHLLHLANHVEIRAK